MSITLDGSNVGTVGVVNSGTAQNTTSGTSIDFTGIPAGVKRITVMLAGVSTNGTYSVLLQLGAGSITSTGYAAVGTTASNGSSPACVGYTTGFGDASQSSANTRSGSIVFTSIGSNTWVCNGAGAYEGQLAYWLYGGKVTLSGTLDRVRLTTVNGTDTFDAGSANILYE